MVTLCFSMQKLYLNGSYFNQNTKLKPLGSDQVMIKGYILCHKLFPPP